MLSSTYSTDIVISYWSYNILEIFCYITINQTASASSIYDEAKVFAIYFDKNEWKFTFA